MVPLLQPVVDAALNLTFPQPCHCCGSKVEKAAYGVACSICWAQTGLIDASGSICPKCGNPGDGGSVTFECRQCKAHHYDLARAVGFYEDAISANLIQLKKVPTIPRILVDLLKDRLKEFEAHRPELIIPVPLSPQRQVERGFNQAEVVATIAGSYLKIPIDTATLTRSKHTPMHRASMDRKARETTVQNAFKVVRPKLIEGRSILLVDDIFTSGATVSNCAKALKKQGSASVQVVTIARTRWA